MGGRRLCPVHVSHLCVPSMCPAVPLQWLVLPSSEATLAGAAADAPSRRCYFSFPPRPLLLNRAPPQVCGQNAPRGSGFSGLPSARWEPQVNETVRPEAQQL